MMILIKNHPRIVNVKTSEVMLLKTNRSMLILDMWMWIPTSQSKIGECSDFVRQGESSPRYTFFFDTERQTSRETKTKLERANEL